MKSKNRSTWKFSPWRLRCTRFLWSRYWERHQCFGRQHSRNGDFEADAVLEQLSTSGFLQLHVTLFNRLKLLFTSVEPMSSLQRPEVQLQADSKASKGSQSVEATPDRFILTDTRHLHPPSSRYQEPEKSVEWSDCQLMPEMPFWVTQIKSHAMSPVMQFDFSMEPFTASLKSSQPLALIPPASVPVTCSAFQC